ncbi:hypothetical protein ACIB24_05110 [Spongisporangium articulatum]|uniref:Guanylate cyclase n=1 Tax=Spongisporangium articulatum TaxID=3362603 RepID=A0ABW8AJA5_9ACTN
MHRSVVAPYAERVSWSGVTLTEASAMTRTGDVWIFRGRSGADRAIQTLTNAPVNHVGMAVVLEDLPPLMWHAELGRSLPDVWAGQKQRGVQLHDLGDAVRVWAQRYGQRAWWRQLTPEATAQQEDAVLQTIARMDGTPFPSSANVFSRWAKGQTRRGRPSRRERAEAGGLESAYCAEVVAMTYQAMGLLPADRSPSWYDPGRFWSGDHLDLLGARLGEEIAVDVTR